MPVHDAPRIYFDYAATAPFDNRLMPALQSASWANANSLHAEGKEAARQLREARSSIAASLGAHAPSEIIFTSGGTEAINMAIKGLAHINPNAKKTHIVVSSIEHHAVLYAANSLKSQGFKIDMIDPNAQGIIDTYALDNLLAQIEDAHEVCALVCIQAVNNELGTIQPVRELARISHAHNALFFCDSVQALGKIQISLEESGIDAASFSAHKIGAPKGIGALYLRRGIKIYPLIHGGGQESGSRSGTSNVPAAVAFAQAVEFAVKEQESTWKHVSKLKARLMVGISNGSYAHQITPTLPDNDTCVPHIVSFLVSGLEGEIIVLRCDNADFAISSGSACSSTSLDPSHVISSLGISRDKALGAIRLSFGQNSSLEEIDRFLEVLPEVLR